MTHHLLDLPKDFCWREECIADTPSGEGAHVATARSSTTRRWTISAYSRAQLFEYLTAHQTHVYVADGDDILKTQPRSWKSCAKPVPSLSILPCYNGLRAKTGKMVFGPGIGMTVYTEHRL